MSGRPLCRRRPGGSCAMPVSTRSLSRYGRAGSTAVYAPFVAVLCSSSASGWSGAPVLLTSFLATTLVRARTPFVCTASAYVWASCVCCVAARLPPSARRLPVLWRPVVGAGFSCTGPVLRKATSSARSSRIVACSSVIVASRALSPGCPHVSFRPFDGLALLAGGCAASAPSFGSPWFGCQLDVLLPTALRLPLRVFEAPAC